jgi:hypothetical protein
MAAPTEGDLHQRLMAMTASTQQALDELPVALQPLLAAKPLRTLVSRLDAPLDVAKLHVMLAAASTALLALYLRIGGVDPKSHSVAKTMESLKVLHGRIRETEQLTSGSSGTSTGSGSASGSSSGAPSKDGRTAPIDVDAAKRFIKAGLGKDASGGSKHAGDRLSGSKRPREEEGDDDEDEKEGAQEGAAAEDGSDISSSDSSDDEKHSSSKSKSSGKATSGHGGSKSGSTAATSGGGSAQKPAATGSAAKKRRTSAGGGPKPDEFESPSIVLGFSHADNGSGSGSQRKGGDRRGAGAAAKPMPSLSHLNWQKEMQDKFGSK